MCREFISNIWFDCNIEWRIRLKCFPKSDFWSIEAFNCIAPGRLMSNVTQHKSPHPQAIRLKATWPQKQFDCLCLWNQWTPHPSELWKCCLNWISYFIALFCLVLFRCVCVSNKVKSTPAADRKLALCGDHCPLPASFSIKIHIQSRFVSERIESENSFGVSSDLLSHISPQNWNSDSKLQSQRYSPCLHTIFI